MNCSPHRSRREPRALAGMRSGRADWERVGWRVRWQSVSITPRPRDHGNLGGEEQQERAPGSTLPPPGWALDPGRGGGRASASVSLSSRLRRAAGAISERWRRRRRRCCATVPPHLLFVLAGFSSPPIRPWGAGPPAGTSSPLGPVGTSCRLPGRGLRRCPAPAPGVAPGSPPAAQAGAALLSTDGSRERREHERMPGYTETSEGVRGQGRAAGRRGVEDSEPRKSSGLMQAPRGARRGGAARPSAETGGEEASRGCRGLTEPPLHPLLSRPGGWVSARGRKG